MKKENCRVESEAKGPSQKATVRKEIDAPSLDFGASGSKSDGRAESTKVAIVAIISTQFAVDADRGGLRGDTEALLLLIPIYLGLFTIFTLFTLQREKDLNAEADASGPAFAGLLRGKFARRGVIFPIQPGQTRVIRALPSLLRESAER